MADNSKRKKATATPFHVWKMIEGLKGLVISRAAVSYRKLPRHWQERIMFEDFVADGVCFLGQRMKSWDPTKGAPTTLAFVTLNNYYNSVLLNHMGPKRGAEVQSIDDVLTGIQDVGEELLQSALTAERVVDRLHKEASFELLCMLDDAFFHTAERSRFRLNSPRFRSLRQEFRLLAHKHGVTIDDYRTVISLHHMRTAAVGFEQTRIAIPER